MAPLRGASALCYSVLFAYAQASDDFLGKAEASPGLGEELQLILGPGINSQFGRVKAQIHPMFLSLPKRSGERLNPMTARYALHRFSMDQHGWSINGMEINQDGFNTTHLPISDILSGLLPGPIVAIFQKHIVQNNGISLDEVTMMAITIEHFVHEDQKGILRTVSEALDLPTVGLMRSDDMRNTIKTYLTIFLGYVTFDDIKKHKSFKRFFTLTADMYPGWADSALLVDDEVDTLIHFENGITNPFRALDSTMELALRVVGRVADVFPTNHWDLECKQIKSDLLEYDNVDTGRIRLADFYRAGLTSRYFYVETKDYLRAVGALDDTDPIFGPKVMIPNLIQDKGNCLAQGHIYSVCCRDECEGLYSHLEKEIAGAEASPELIISLVAALSSSTVHAPRNLSAPLVSRLSEIATLHGGNVIVHSRLFAQWMHQAFPSECRYPHLAGTTTQIDPELWEQQTGLESRIDHAGRKTRREVMLRHIEELDAQFIINNETLNKNTVEESAEDMWSTEDEYLVEPQTSLLKSITQSWTFLALSFVMGVGALLSNLRKRMVSGENGKPAHHAARGFTV